MRTFDALLSKGLLGLAALLLAGIVPLAAQQSRQLPAFKSPEAAYEQGIGSWKGGFVEHAIPALRYAADHEVFLAQFYLAKILADSSTPYTDHVAAYQLYRKIAIDYANIDPEDDNRRQFVARALTALAGYVRSGLPQIGLRPEPVRALEYLRHAAQFFNDEEAQFDLAKTYLQGEGVPRDTRAGLHWLSVLTQRGHAGAQAFLADVYWRGRYSVMRDPTRAFALITVAVENAPESERVWIEDIYHNIFCGAPAGTRTQAQGMVADWRQKYGRAVTNQYRSALGALPPQAERTCSNGEAVIPPPSRTQSNTAPTAPPRGLLDIGVTGTTLAPR
jgi:TPR repeat protein